MSAACINTYLCYLRTIKIISLVIFAHIYDNLYNGFHSIEGGITGRGCSTKDKVYYKECETNSYGEGTEKFCYCNFYLCNSSPTQFGSHSPILLTVILAPLLMSALQRRWDKYFFYNFISILSTASWVLLLLCYDYPSEIYELPKKSFKRN